MADNQNPNPPQDIPPPPSKSSASGEIGHNGSSGYPGGAQKVRYPNPPDPTNPDPVTLREQWRFAIRQYSKWYSHAWGTAILAGLSFFALGWIVKGSNPIPSFGKHEDEPNRQQQQSQGHDIRSPPVPPPFTSSPSDAYETPKS